MKQQYAGSCHCGKVRFQTRLDLHDCMVCDCSICTKKGAIVVKVPEEDFELLTAVEDLQLYTFNKQIAKHYFCPVCGVHTFNRPRTTPELWAVNLRCLQEVNLAELQPRPVQGSKLD